MLTRSSFHAFKLMEMPLENVIPLGVMISCKKRGLPLVLVEVRNAEEKKSR